MDVLKGKERRTRPIDLGPAREPIEANLHIPNDPRWIEPIPDSLVSPERDPADVAVTHDSIRLALIAALQQLPARQRAALLLCDVLRWEAAEVAGVLETSTAAVNSALQRARATLAKSQLSLDDKPQPLRAADRDLLERYVTAFERYDFETLTAVIRADASQSMPPFDMWLSGRENLFAWWVGPGNGCRGSRVLAAGTANGLPAYGQYKPSPQGGFDPWALQVVELSGGKISDLTFFLDTERLFPLFGLPPRLDA